MSLIDIYKDDVMWQKSVKYSLQKEKKNNLGEKSPDKKAIKKKIQR